MLSQRIEKINQGGLFTRAQLCKQADGFQQGISGLLIVSVWPALLILPAIVFPDQFSQRSGHIYPGICVRVVQSCQRAAAFGANLGAN